MRASAQRFGAVVLLALGLQGCSALSALNTLGARDRVASASASEIAYGDHPRQQLDIYTPVNAAGPAPVVLFIYGGNWSDGRRQDYAFAGSALASRGFVTVIADYRLVPEVRFPAFVEDGALALRWIQDNIAGHGGDPERIAIAGHSAGAYNAVMLGLDVRYLNAAGVNRRRIKAIAGLAGPYVFQPSDVAVTTKAFGAHPDPAETQPVNFARADAPPAFLATGIRDTTVLPRHTRALAARLRAKGAPVTDRYYADVSHVSILTSLTRLFRSQSTVLADLTVFLNRHLGAAKAAGPRQGRVNPL